MTIKESYLYSSLRVSCDELHEGMRGSQNMDCVVQIEHISNPRCTSDGMAQ